MNIDTQTALLWGTVAFSLIAVVGPAIFVAIYSRNQEKKDVEENFDGSHD
jgi:hypothetical protein